MQRLEVLVAVMLARERRAPADAVADGCTELAAALNTLPSRPLEMVAEAVAALGVQFDAERSSGAARNLASPLAVQQPSAARAYADEDDSSPTSGTCLRRSTKPFRRRFLLRLRLSLRLLWR